eukprot:gnl/TRDRNA2_/TRDRNA2_115549_c1_seq1.p1 gnl/TRDRNA2_/TRDRNA2_115549_c1~~gnl/TRDRNA2_/TRDRNA2_115549_c1_seq1.p1  ORF type:complete len:374 (-),score=48.84 gnl/TRDRNA2_/TRDRNA2_115549_c1_seq1:111-1085(-)
MGFATCTEHLIACRLLTGLSVAGLASAITTSLADVSTPLNRARTMSTLTSFINAGFAIGPALGGIVASALGMRECFFLVGGCVVASSIISHGIILETMLTPPKFLGVSGVFNSYQVAFKDWAGILRTSNDMRLLSTANTVLQVAQGGAAGTLLPLFLSFPPLEFSTATVGLLFAGMAAVGVVAARPLASLADKYGRVPAMASGLAILGTSIALVPHAGTPAVVAGVLTSWAVGNNIASPLVSALTVDAMATKNPAQIPQALSLVRTAGDIGMLMGATTLGTVALNYGMPVAFDCSSCLTFVAMSVFVLKLKYPGFPGAAAAGKT